MSEWFKKLKTTMNPGILIMLAVGIMLLLMSCSTDKSSQNGSVVSKNNYDIQESEEVPNDETELISYYEKKFEKLLKEVKGIGEVKVMLSPDLSGACILCEGAGSVEVQSDITKMCNSLFEIPAHKVQIYEIKKESEYDG